MANMASTLIIVGFTMLVTISLVEMRHVVLRYGDNWHCTEEHKINNTLPHQFECVEWSKKESEL